MRCDILAKAAECVEKGWCRNYRHLDGQVCALGAIEDARGYFSQQGAEYDPLTQPLVVFLASLLPDQYATQTTPYHMLPDQEKRWRAAWKVANWNNAPTQTQEGVAAKFREAAALCRAGVTDGTTQAQVQEAL